MKINIVINQMLKDLRLQKLFQQQNFKHFLSALRVIRLKKQAYIFLIFVLVLDVYVENSSLPFFQVLNFIKKLV